jgi:CBS domain-containing protein
MSAGRICVRKVNLASPDESVREAARRMREAEVGTLIVVDEKRSPVGIVTDRDVALGCVAEGRDPDSTKVAAVMTAPVVCVYESTPIEEALGRMAGIAARRLGVTDDDGRLVGILALDDVLELLVEEAETIGRLLHRRQAPLET